MAILAPEEIVDRLVELKETGVWLQGLGAVRGKPAGELKVGDGLVWNYGYTSTVSAILKETKATVTIEESYISDRTGEPGKGTRTMKKTRLVATHVGGKFMIMDARLEEVNLAKRLS